MTESEPGFELIVVGASAGGIDALSRRVVASLPTAFPTPIVIAQHLDPRRPSHLAEILARRTELRVRTVEATLALEPGTVYVVPSNRHVDITDHEVRVSEAGEDAPRPSVDRLLTSAAGVFGEALIAVILTGMGSDGATGARIVKGAGGMVVVQSEASAAFPSMPMSLAPTTVDIVSPLETMGQLLYDVVSGAYTPTEEDDDRTLRGFLDRLRERTGIDFSSYKRATIVRRLQRRMAATGRSSLRDYARYALATDEEIRRLTSAFLIKVTEFFRDADLFEHLRTDVMPRLVEGAKEHDHELRIWSAGCATGEEAYSLAILVCEALGSDLDHHHVRIFATDLDADAIAFARRGVYPASALEGMAPALIERYFTFIDGDYEIRKFVRNLMIFGQHDLGQRAPFPRIDLALCRNVLIYFTPELQKRALQLFAFSLRDSAYLVLGKAESTTPLADHFELDQPRLKVYRRHGDRVLIPPARIRDVTPRPPVRFATQRAAWAPAGVEHPSRDRHRTPSASERAENLLLRLPIGVVTVDRAYDIQWINSQARMLLGIHATAVGHDFVHLTSRIPSDELRGAIDRAFGGETTELELELMLSQTVSGRRWVHLQFHAQPTSGAERSPDHVAIMVSDVSAQVAERRAQASLAESERERGRDLTGQVQALTQSYGELLEANQELATSNTELRSANEELLMANEEVQAATEEVETLNEELQATNEELETLNEELQATVEELNTTNDDLSSRSIELQEIADALMVERTESELSRRRLETALEASESAVLIADAAGAVVLANRRWEAATQDARFLDDAGQELEGSDALVRRSLTGEAFRQDLRLVTQAGADRSMTLTAVPLEDGGRTRGAVLVLRERTPD